jgi:hypothetical protein
MGFHFSVIFLVYSLLCPKKGATHSFGGLYYEYHYTDQR